MAAPAQSSDGNHAPDPSGRRVPADEPPVLRELVTQCLDLMRTGDTDVVDEVCRDNPEHAELIRDCVSALHEARQLYERAGGNLQGTAIPERLGDFRLLRRIGGGGMGVVYLAEEEGLGRRVALKLMRPEYLIFDTAKARFRRETEAVASLKHPGIVPVLTVGEERGLPFFTMELVDGCSLAELLHEFTDRDPQGLSGAILAAAVRRHSPLETRDSDTESSQRFLGTWTQACLRIVRDGAHALNHAHQRRIVHRDVKPSNIMITASGRVMLVDFGIAQLEHDEKLTRTGSVMGSLDYMSPEQVKGERVDERTDVYSLGATLYELLTLRVPFQADSANSLAKAILEHAPLSLRTRNRGVPRDAETVCLKALEKTPADRYQSVADFARDLDNVLELRPLEARRPGPATRTTRWVQRHRAASVAIALAMLVTIGGPLAFGFHEHRARSAIEHQRNRARENLRRLHGIVEQQLMHVERLAEVPGVQENYRVMILAALAHYREFLAQVEAEQERDPELRRDVARAQTLVADLHRRLGQTDRAILEATKADAHWLTLIADAPDDLAARFERADVLRRRSRDRVVLDDYAGGDADADLATELLQRVLGESPDPALRVRATATLAVLHGRRALQAIEAGRGPDAAQGFAEQALAQWKTIDAEVGEHPEWQRARADLHAGLGRFHFATGEPKLAAEHFELALADARKHAGAHASPSDRARMALILQSLGAVYGSTRRFDQTRKAQDESVAIYRRLHDDFPKNPGYGHQLAGGLMNQALLSFSTGRVDGETVRTIDEAIAAAESAAHNLGASTMHAIQLSRIHGLAAIVKSGVPGSDRTAISAHYQKGIAVVADLAVSHADHPELRSQVGAALNNAAEWYLEIDQLDTARQLLERAIPHQRHACALNPRNQDHRRFLRNHHFSLARVHLRRHAHAEAMVALREVAGLMDGDGRAWGDLASRAAQCAALSRDDAASFAAYSEQAIRWIRAGLDAGWPAAARGLERPEFALLQGIPAFETERRRASGQ